MAEYPIDRIFINHDHKRNNMCTICMFCDTVINALLQSESHYFYTRPFQVLLSFQTYCHQSAQPRSQSMLCHIRNSDTWLPTKVEKEKETKMERTKISHFKCHNSAHSSTLSGAKNSQV